MIRIIFAFFLIVVMVLQSCREDDLIIDPKPINIISLAVNNQIKSGTQIKDVPLDPTVTVTFDVPYKPESITTSNISISVNNSAVPLTFNLKNATEVEIIPSQTLKHLTGYSLTLDVDILSSENVSFKGASYTLITSLDTSDKKDRISDEALLDSVAYKTFLYFWDGAHPVSGMALERNSSPNTVTSGGSGFGIMAIVAAMERQYISREAGVERLSKIVTFLTEKSERFHGAWSHWLDGTTGLAQPFSQKDNGADIVETSYLINGLLTARQYLNENDNIEKQIIDQINALWEAVEWSWFTRGGQNVLYWHWSPDYEWEMNHRIEGYNECLITYILAASSPTFPIEKPAYDEGWARNGNIKNGKLYYDINLPVGFDYGGPLFFAHYSFLGLDPRQLKDQYADYWAQNTNHTLINRQYCINNPKNFYLYSEHLWGLTASDNHNGYSAHSPTNDLGVISPTAALSSIPYTPEASMDVIRFLYYKLGDRIWGKYGFYDALTPDRGWFANSYLAIDQGPIVVMIENHRSALIWDLFMSCPEVQDGLEKLGFE